MKNYMKNKMKKAVLLLSAVVSSIGSYAISTGGAVAAGLGTAAAVTLVGVGAHKHKQNKREQCEENNYKGRKCDKYKKSSKHKQNAQQENTKQVKKDLRQ